MSAKASGRRTYQAAFVRPIIADFGQWHRIPGKVDNRLGRKLASWLQTSTSRCTKTTAQRSTLQDKGDKGRTKTRSQKSRKDVEDRTSSSNEVLRSPHACCLTHGSRVQHCLFTGVSTGQVVLPNNRPRTRVATKLPRERGITPQKGNYPAKRGKITVRLFRDRSSRFVCPTHSWHTHTRARFYLHQRQRVLPLPSVAASRHRRTKRHHVRPSVPPLAGGLRRRLHRHHLGVSEQGYRFLPHTSPPAQADGLQRNQEWSTFFSSGEKMENGVGMWSGSRVNNVHIHTYALVVLFL